MSCAICNLRKEKRFCLAVHGRICPQCCGEQREVTLECPSECPYLQQARQHEKPRENEPGIAEELFPKVAITAAFLDQHQPLITGLLHGISKISRRSSHLHDRELLGAISAMAQSQQTLLASGLVYQEAMPNPAQQSVIDALRELLQEFRRTEEQHLGYTRLKDRDVLHALVFIVRFARLHTSGRPLARGFIDYLHEAFAAAEHAVTAEPQGRIIMP